MPSSVPLQISGLLDNLAASSPADLRLDGSGTFSFTSAIRTASPENNRVTGRLFRAEEPTIRSGTVILLHGWNAELCYTRMFPGMAALLNAANINVVTIELPYHMHRRPRSGPVDDFISCDLPTMLQATQQAVADIRSLCCWLQKERMTPIGLWGFSLGAWLAGLTLRLEQQLGCAVLTTPIVRIDRAISELAFCEPVRLGLAQQRITLDELNLTAAKPQIAPGQLLLIESRHDLFAPAETVEELWHAWEHPDIWRLAHGHISILMSTAVTRRTVQWIRERLREGTNH